MNPIHIVDNSPWPMLVSISIVTLIISSDLINVLLLLLLTFQWFRDILRESKGGFHTIKVQKGLTIGFLLFLISEIMLFFSFFWAYFHSSLAPTVDIGLIWPPLGINWESQNTWGIPLCGSIILLSSGFVVTLSHHALILGNKLTAQLHLLIAILLGILFIILQTIEYTYGEFTISDSVFGSVFYMTTGLHAIHVIIGVLF